MKKWLMAVAFILMVVPAAWAGYQDYMTYGGGYTQKGWPGRWWEVLSRGVVNVVAFPFEIPRSIVHEAEMHPRLWPVTVVPRTATNIAIRASSAVNDIFFYPFVLPFTHDISPWTEHFGLPAYPWQTEPTQ